MLLHSERNNYSGQNNADNYFPSESLQYYPAFVLRRFFLDIFGLVNRLVADFLDFLFDLIEVKIILIILNSGSIGTQVNLYISHTLKFRNRLLNLHRTGRTIHSLDIQLN